MIEWLWFFIPLWTLGFFIGVYASEIGDAMFNPPKAIVLPDKFHKD